MALYSLENHNQSEEKESPDSEEAASASKSDEEKEGNAGWADSIAKVLCTTKPRTKNTLVLARAKKNKVSDKNEKNGYGFEIDGEVKDEKPQAGVIETNFKQTKNQQLGLRVKPSWKDIDRERTLRKVATRGVVQLFNAVRMQQKDVQIQLEEAGPLDSRKEAVLNNINKRKFLDILMSGKRSKSEPIDNPVKNEFLKEKVESDEEIEDKKKNREWNVLRDDFLTNKKNIKHWDEEDVSQHESSSEEN